ncbi:MAG: peptidylprolyl isomerase [Gammaproteobacteria bacterium]|nr:peptidylprolyl isomerase [Gammaproteobacteria bacterium]MAY02114.1 peptidylprolyl isomerase [Gammaproteobacteria bacterium]|tara:strand:+ start:1067 stop:1780 length:714 start_codon:yes stop_codon:yes gene_type:complete
MNSFGKVRITALLSTFIFSFIGSSSLFAQALDLEQENVRAGYSIGVNIGLNLASQGILGEDVDDAALIQGIQDAIDDSIQLSDEEIVAALDAYSQQMQARANQELQAAEQASIDFLADNALEPGVMTTASGLQYMVLEEGDNPDAPMPGASDEVRVHYHGTMIDGTVFDSSVERGEPISFPLDGVIAGWTEGLQLMQVGDKYRFFIPSDLAYGANGAGPIPPFAALIFDVELLGIVE